MIGRLGAFVAELRDVGLAVSTAEALDATAALQHVDLGSRNAVREALAATLVKVPRHRAAFDIAFDVFFGSAGPASATGEPAVVGTAPSAAGGGATGVDDLLAVLADALQTGDRAALLAAVRRAVDELSGFQPGRPVGGRYYLYRVMQRLAGLEGLLTGDGAPVDALDARLRRADIDGLLGELRAEVRAEIVRRLIEDRGVEPVARTLRETLVEDLDLMHATRSELEKIEAAVEPLARKLATRLAQRRRRGRRGRLDVRRTIRRSLSHGGVMLEPQFRPPRKSKPELLLLCDVSGSVATFARFTMQLTYAIGHQFSRVRSFAFVDGVDEVTRFFGPGSDFHDALLEMNRTARLVGHDGHSDYGAVWRQFRYRFFDAVTANATVIITGDARNNYRSDGIDDFQAMAREARSVFWLNPEARRFWDTGDSIMSRYGAGCDNVFEVRTLRQLESFVERVALAPRSQRHPRFV